MNNKYCVGNRVMPKSGPHKGEIFRITALKEVTRDQTFDTNGIFDFGTSVNYVYKVESAKVGITIFDEDDLLLVPETDYEKNLRLFKESLNEKSDEPLPKFEVGDVVQIMDFANGVRKVGIVEEVVSNGNKFEYRVADYNAPYSGYTTYQEYMMSFKKHDTHWEKYFTEMMDNYKKKIMNKIFSESTETEDERPVKVFKQGNRVKVVSNLVEGTGVILETSGEESFSEYRVRVDGEHNDRLFYEKNLELLPKFKIGDVVNSADTVYVVSDIMYNESVIGNKISPNYSYEVTLLDSINDVAETYHVLSEGSQYELLDESSLEFQYHDTQWEKYFTEGNRQPPLPAWRGEYYNPYDIYRDFIDLKDEKVVGSSDEYNDCTLPIYRMTHILRDHSVYSRIQHVLVHSGSTFKQSNIDMMLSKLNLSDEDELRKLYGGIRNKIAKLNEDPAPTIANSKIRVKFTEIEREFVNLLDAIDPKDHWPVNMSNIMIMDAIREAYENAEKDGDRQYSSSGSKTSDKPAAPNKGKMLYKGTSTRHGGLIVQFWYNFDLDIIETAYPISETKSNRRSR